MIRRQKSMRFLGGYYAFPGGKVDPEGRRAGHSRPLSGPHGGRRPDGSSPPSTACPALAFWVAAVRELLEETGVLRGLRRHRTCDRPTEHPADAARIEALPCGSHGAARAARAPASPPRAGTSIVGPFRYLSHFITPPSSPIRFTRAILSRPGSDGPEPAHSSRGGLGELLGRAGRGLSPPPERGVGHGRAGR